MIRVKKMMQQIKKLYIKWYLKKSLYIIRYFILMLNTELHNKII
jgi:Sec7-like guanine-nucleotide exchange factor